MPYFAHKQKKIILITNYKVMYSSLHMSENYNCISEGHKLEFTIQMQDYEYYLLTRNPYKRVLSFYKDKFHQHPLKTKITSPSPPWQRCQKMFFPHLGITSETPFEEIKNKLINTSLNDFIKHLPACYNLDGHLYPQHWIEYPTQTTFIKIESQKELTKLSQKADIDISKKENQTDDIKIDERLSPESIKIINQLYESDFITYQYPITSNE